VGELLAKQLFERLRWKCDDNIKMDIMKIGCQGWRWLEEAQDRVQWQFFILEVLNLLVLLP
jgi:hypothetical protein